MTRLGNDWQPGRDGVPFRKAARVVVIDGAGSVLLFHGHDGDDPDHQWWFTPGGGLQVGETARQGAARELHEETGFLFLSKQLLGPAVHRVADFQFTNVLARQEEEFFLAYLDGIRPEVDTSAHTSSERKLVDSWGWFSAAELQVLAEDQTVFPACLPQLLERWATGWDGSAWNLFEVSDSD